MNILGLSAFYHDSAAALVRDGRIVAAAQEERFTRIRHDAAFPSRAIEACLGIGGIAAADLDAVVFYEKPLLKFERLLETALAFAPRGFPFFLRAMPGWLSQKLHIPREIDRGLGGDYSGPIWFTTHHESHAASAFFPSPFERAAILTLDGVGEWTTTSWGVGEGGSIDLREEIRFPHSLGLLYSAFTYYAGFRVNSGEYKLMGLAPYGTPKYRDLILENLVHIRPDGSFRLDPSYFRYTHGLTMTSPKFHRLFGRPPSKPDSKPGDFEQDIAASIQSVTEEIVLRIARHIHERTGEENLCLAGGVALNCVANGRLLREGPFKNLWIQPAAGDAGGALGAALFGWHGIAGHPRTPGPSDSQQGSLLGASFSDEEARAALEAAGAVFQHFENEDALAAEAARLLAEGLILGHVEGRAEFGPRALGQRSILGDPRDPGMQRRMNLAIKFRESFRPFAPAVMEGRQSELFDLDAPSPYMLLTAPVRPELRTGSTSGIRAPLTGHSKIPAVTHVDFSARIQTVSPDRSPRFHKILSAFDLLTGCPALVNTSFNIRGEPIVNTPAEAYRCFQFTDMDALIVGPFLLLKKNQPPMPGAAEYKRRFQPD
jgi:carbamoyltransferase